MVGSLGASARKEILEAVQSSPELRKEIAKVFQRANRRIQNLENSGAFSPALQSLGSLGEGFTKFGFTGKDWQELKMQYGKAIAFLNQPTSTATGAKEYDNQIKERYNLRDEEFNALIDEYSGKLSSLTGSVFVEKYLKNYKDFSGDFEQAVSDASDQMESDAVRLQQELQNDLNREADQIANEIEQHFKEIADNLRREFGDLSKKFDI